jgi:hypothetical protein
MTEGVYVIFEDTYYDGSGTADVHGVFSTKEKAEACAFRVMAAYGDGAPPIRVLEFKLDVEAGTID